MFVHCHAGISRSATVCIAYVMKHHQTDLTQAYDFVKQKRPCISPNLHFMGQLLAFQKQLQLTSSCCSNESAQTEEMDCHSLSESGPPSVTPFLIDGAIDFTVERTTVSPAPTADDLLLYNTSAHQIPVSVPHQQASDCSSVMGSKRSISVPGSLSFSLAKPKRKNLCAPPKFPVRYNQSTLEFHCSTDSVLHSHSALTMTTKPTKLSLTSISLPSTPVNQSKNHLLTSTRLRTAQCLRSSSCVRQSTLQLSPCRVVAKTWDHYNGGHSLDSPVHVPTTIAL